MKYLILIMILVGCGKEPVARQASNNPDIPVDVLFEKDGCKVYRFEDFGEHHYFTNCTETISNQSYQCGKTVCHRDVNVKTVRQ